MTREEIIEVLSKSVFFSKINLDKIEKYIDSSEIVSFSKGKLFLDDELKKYIFIPLTGTVKSYQINPKNGKAYTIFLFHQGDVFDIITFIDNQEHEVLFEVVKKGEFIKISHELLDKWIKEETQLNKNILFLLSKMLLHVEQNASDLALYDTFTRLSKLIVRNICYHSFSSEIKSKVKLKHIDKLSHEEIAHLIGTAREVVSRHIKVLKEKKILEKNKRNYHIVNLEELLNHCHLPKIKKSKM